METDSEYDDLLKTEETFLQRVCDDEIERLYRAARTGDRAAKLRLIDLSSLGWTVERGMNLREAKADGALRLLYWFNEMTN